MFKLAAMHELSSLLENNSKQLQSASLTAEQASTSIDKMCIRLDELRTNEEFERLITKVETITGLSVSVGAGPVGACTENVSQQEEEERASTSRKRKRKCPAKMTDFVVHTKTANETSTLHEKAELKRLFYETIDAVKNAAKSRFEQDDLHILKAIERFILRAANKDYSVPEDLAKDLVKLSEIIDLRELTSEAQELPVYLKLHNRNSSAPITKVTKVSTICDVMNSVSDSKDCLPHIHQLLKLCMSVPLGSVTAERTFSVMRRVKSWLRSSMSSNTLNNRIFSVIHNELTKCRRKRWPKSLSKSTNSEGCTLDSFSD